MAKGFKYGPGLPLSSAQLKQLFLLPARKEDVVASRSRGRLRGLREGAHEGQGVEALPGQRPRTALQPMLLPAGKPSPKKEKLLIGSG